ncbi:MAG TPA: hypothetical protein VGK67_04635 [Myxococcales bacterium]|jgi:hypothetical protein
MRTLAVVLLAVVALACTACRAPCAYGPTEIKDVTMTATAGAAIDETIQFPAGSVGVFKDVSPKDAPAGLTFTLADDSVKVGGSVATAGKYTFQVLVNAGDACAEWARYDVELTVN